MPETADRVVSLSCQWEHVVSGLSCMFRRYKSCVTQDVTVSTHSRPLLLVTWSAAFDISTFLRYFETIKIFRKFRDI